jgi:hypothetical protein
MSFVGNGEHIQVQSWRMSEHEVLWTCKSADGVCGLG